MTDDDVEGFISSMLAGQPPRHFDADADNDIATLALAIDLRAVQGESAWPEEQFVEQLQRRLAATKGAGSVLRLSPARSWPHDAAGRTDMSNSRSRRRRTRPAAFVVLGRLAAAAAILLAGSLSALQLGGSHPRSPAVPGAASASAFRSAELLAVHGDAVGQTYTFRGPPSWVLMDVRGSGLAGNYVCELELDTGTKIMAGIMVVRNGGGQWAHTVSIDVSQLRRAMLETSTGEIVATATLA